MLKLAALASLVSLFLLSGCFDASANASTSGRRGCTIATAPASVAPIMVAADPASVDQISPSPVVIVPTNKAASVPTKAITKKKVKAKLPESGLYEVSGYTSTPGQTDATPCIAADTSDICRRKAAGELICASNAFPLGTKIHVAGLGTCVVADRMNSRYQHHVDWYFGQDMGKKAEKLRRAFKIGRRDRAVTIVTR